jgi:hypothetical protein
LLTLIKLIANLTKKKMEQRQASENAAPMPAFKRRRPVEVSRQPMPAPMVVMPVTQNIPMLYVSSHNEFMSSLGNVANAEERRNMIGNFIYPFVQEVLFNQLRIDQSQTLAGKVTGMIISLQEHELMHATATFDTLAAKVREAFNLIQASGLAY